MERPWKIQNLSLDLDEFERYTDKIKIDRISKLPDALLLQILSFLQVQDVMRVCCVSTRWKHLWKSVPSIDFTEAKIRTTGEFIRAVNKALSNRGGLQIREFRVCVDSDLCQINNVDYWITFVVSHNVEVLYLDCTPDRPVSVNKDKLCLIPQSLYRCQYLHTLTLKFCQMDLPSIFCLASLRKLHLELVEFTNEDLEVLLSNCPSLKYLTLKNCSKYTHLRVFAKNSHNENLNIHEDGLNSETDLLVSAPNLLTLNFSGQSKRERFFGENLKSLVSVNFNFSSTYRHIWDPEDCFLFGQFIDHFCYVKSLKLSNWCILNLSIRAILNLGTSVSNMVSNTVNEATLATRFNKCELAGLVYVLKNFINLGVLILNVVEDVETKQHLRTVAIHGILGSKSFSSTAELVPTEDILDRRRTEFEFVRFLLKNLKELETMFITPTEGLNTFSDSKKLDILFQLSSRLLSLPRSSPNVQVIIRPIQHTGIGINRTQLRL
ncbi:F-box/FBD/LRR-repeat protein At5g22700-like isoform X2 [Dioscorea cayenensis subsp. rotundata]|uniref:F-box/FBD/LRR-repeat protein At5g22700-like isoform X2 n=1 Tax=Dioscorea cayennensis subsp. rotundata TaxID=55577 RepID=A0AB40D2R0_DIOCR|nr:F-box/FBD/LRR-repeat protein At5g22700-like isoform X2 [Dioscorea cayenensis subsp. rotundata]